MSTTVLSILFLGILVVVDVVAPLAFGLMAARSNARYRTSRRTEGSFWGMTAGYLVLAGAIGGGLIETVAHPQIEGLAAFSAEVVLAGFTLPGSAVPVLLSAVLAFHELPRPFGLGSLTVWLVIGVLCWTFFDAAVLRWILQSKRRARIRSGHQSRT